MDQMCPNWPKNEVFVSFLKFKPSDSADFAYLSFFQLCLSIYLVFGLWKYSRPLNLAVSKLFLGLAPSPYESSTVRQSVRPSVSNKSSHTSRH